MNIKLADKIDPRTKMIIVLVLSTLGVLIQDIFYQLGVLFLTVILLKAFKVKLFNLYPKAKRFIPLFFGLLLIQSIFSPSGSSIIVIKGIPIITTGGVFKGISVVIRMLIIISSVMILSTSTYQEIILGLIKIKIPYEIAFMVLIAIRFLPILVEEFKDVFTAVQLRGIQIDRIPFGQKLQIYTYILMPVVISAVLRAKKVATAMEARAFRAYPKRTYLQDLVLSKNDYLVMISVLVLGVLYYVFYYLRG